MEQNQPKPALNPSAMTLADAALLLTKAGGQPVTTAMIATDSTAGAPANADGTLNDRASKTGDTIGTGNVREIGA